MALKVSFADAASNIFSSSAKVLDKGSQLYKKAMTSYSVEMQNEIYGRYHAIHKKTFDPIAGKALFEGWKDFNVLSVVHAEVMNDLYRANDIMMMFKRDLPRQDILDKYTGLSERGQQTVTRYLGNKIDLTSDYHFERAFEDTYGRMDEQATEQRHLFALKNIRDHNRKPGEGIGMGHLNSKYYNEIAAIQKSIHDKTAGPYYDENEWKIAADTLIMRLEGTKKSPSLSDDVVNEKKRLESQMAILKAISDGMKANLPFTAQIEPLEKQLDEQTNKDIDKILRSDPNGGMAQFQDAVEELYLRYKTQILNISLKITH